MDDRQRQERIEGALTFARIRQLEEKPVQGQFNVGHLREIHRRIFQDHPHHSPGEFRPDVPAHLKARGLESGDRYYVHYAPRKAVDMGFVQVLDELNRPTGLRDLAPDRFAERMARLYGDVDYLPPSKREIAVRCVHSPVSSPTRQGIFCIGVPRMRMASPRTNSI